MKNLIEVVFDNKKWIEARYICKFTRKTGNNVVSFVNEKAEAEAYKKWYLSDEDKSSRNIHLSENRITKLLKEDIEEFEYRKVTKLQESVIDPLMAFLKRPNIIKLSPLGVFMIFILICLYYYFDSDFSFVGEESINTFNGILAMSTSIFYLYLFLWAVATVSIGILRNKNDMKNYYLGTFANKRNIGNQIVMLVLLIIILNTIIEPSILTLLSFMQTKGYFLQ